MTDRQASLQTTLDGREIPMQQVNHDRARNAAGYGPVQLRILQHIDHHGTITSTQAGLLVHAHRPKTGQLLSDGAAPEECPHAARRRIYNVVPAAAASDRWPGPDAQACCPWTSSDGLMAMRRLMERGTVTRHPEQKGHWVRT